MRLATLGLFHEANTFSKHRVDLAAMDAAGVLRGDQITKAHAGGTSTMSGYLAAADALSVDVAPLVMTGLVPAGPITDQALTVRADEMARMLRKHGPFDGVLTALHGAAAADTVEDVDGYLLARIRDVVGPDVPIGASLDLHANISAEMCKHADVLNTYRTNPHVDARAVAEEVVHLVADTVRGRIRPTQALVRLPAVINILAQNTAVTPMREIMGEADVIRAGAGVLSVSVAQGYPYADVADMGMSVVVVTDDDPAAAAVQAMRLADIVWARRTQFEGHAVPPDEAITRVARSMDGPVLLLDVGDNIGGGAPGDSVVLLAAARRQGLASVLTIVNDPVSARACTHAGVGATLDLSIGAASGPEVGPAVDARGTVVALHDGTYATDESVHAGMRHFDAGPSAAVELDTGQTVIVTSRAVMPLTIAQLTTLGLDPSHFQVIVAKGVHSPLAGYGPHVTQVIAVDTPGITTADLAQLPYQRRRRPMYPFEPHTDFPDATERPHITCRRSIHQGDVQR